MARDRWLERPPLPDELRDLAARSAAEALEAAAEMGAAATRHRELATRAARIAEGLIEALACTPGADSADAALRALIRRWEGGDYHHLDACRLASVLASWQPPDVLLDLLRAPPAADPAVASFVAAALDRIGEELALRDVPVPGHAPKSGSERYFQLPRHRSPLAPALGPALAPASAEGWVELPTPEHEREAEDWFVAWPNATAAVALFQGPESDASAGPAHAAAARVLPAPAVHEVPFERALAGLFGRLAGGGCYGQGLWGAAARPAAWSIVRALLGADGEPAETEALRCRWFELVPPPDIGVPGFGFAVLRPWDRRMAILAVDDHD